MNLRAALLFSLFALLVTSPLRAQEPAQETAAPEVKAAEEAPEQAEAPVTGTAAAGAQGSESPLLDDYEASEQISEDLSVAFPVDI